jgi:hypothetical protein
LPLALALFLSDALIQNAVVRLLRQYPINKVLDLRHVIGRIGLDDLVILLVPIGKFGLFSGREMVDKFCL